jgi:Coenzyme PQQ synthesis protein D (PqqD)
MMRLSQNVRTVTNSDGGVLLDLHQGKMFQLNSTAATILEDLANGVVERGIAARISERCGIDLALASADVRSFLASLEDYGLLEEGDRH